MPLGTGLTGLGLVGAGAYSTFARAPESKSDIERAIWTGTGYGELGAGAKMLADSARRYRNPNLTLPTDDLAAVEGAQRMGAGGRVAGPVAPPSTASAYAAPSNAAATPGRLAQALTPEIIPESMPPAMSNAPAPAETDASQPAKQRHGDRLVSAAKKAGASGPLTKAGAAEHLLANLDDTNRGTVAKALGVPNGPNLHKRLMASIRDMASKLGASAILAGIVGATAASTDPAEAADGSTASNLGNRAIAGGTAAGTAYGISKIAERLGPTVSAALGAGGTMMMPMAAADASDAFNLTPDQIDADAHKAAQIMPEWARRLYSGLGLPQVENAYQMAQVPARGDRSDEAMIARAQAEQAEAMPMTSAAALEVPQGIPAPNPDGAPTYGDAMVNAGGEQPYSPYVAGRLSRMQKYGATPEQIARFLNQAVR
jgi:hypothetical protein